MKKVMIFSACGLSALAIFAACNSSLTGSLLGGTNGTTGTNDTNGTTEVVAAFLPSGVSMDVSELPNEDNSSSKIKNDSSLPSLTPYQRTLRSAARIVFNFHMLADHALAFGSHIRNDMTSPTQTQVEGSFLVDTQTVNYKADFAAFDIDGDGHADGSGNAVDLPVAVRVWADRGNGYERFLCALVTTKPSTDNLGAGRLYASPGTVRGDDAPDIHVFVNWDRTDPAHKWNEAFVSGQLRQDLKIADGHERVDVRTESSDNSLEKTVRSANNFADNPYGLQTNQASVHFKPGSGFALLDGQATGTGGTFSFSDVCVDLALQGLATGGQCNTFDTQDMTFIYAPVSGETDFPADFPATPTFTTTVGG